MDIELLHFPRPHFEGRQARYAILLELLEKRRHLAAAYVAGRILRKLTLVGLPEMQLDVIALDDEIVWRLVADGEAELPDVEVARLGNFERR